MPAMQMTRLTWDHPRTCGEKYIWKPFPSINQGSPPHMRGKARSIQIAMRVDGITPAHAGKRDPGRPWLLYAWDHPRTCGEKVTNIADVSRRMGSPPHMRGKAFGNSASATADGITPAHAGKSIPHRTCYKIQRDHPRTCGEKLNVCIPDGYNVGSPPHMRGKAIRRCHCIPPLRITPAHAGKRHWRSGGNAAAWDHPRTCGEKKPTFGSDFFTLGSPPHMRGKVVNNTLVLQKLGITPAHAGKRILYRQLKAQKRDHPRTCGEKSPARDSMHR